MCDKRVTCCRVHPPYCRHIVLTPCASLTPFIVLVVSSTCPCFSPIDSLTSHTELRSLLETTRALISASCLASPSPRTARQMVQLSCRYSPCSCTTNVDPRWAAGWFSWRSFVSSGFQESLVVMAGLYWWFSWAMNLTQADWRRQCRHWQKTSVCGDTNREQIQDRSD